MWSFDHCAQSNLSTPPTTHPKGQSGGDNEDEELARALALSMQEQQEVGVFVWVGGWV